MTDQSNEGDGALPEPTEGDATPTPPERLPDPVPAPAGPAGDEAAATPETQADEATPAASTEPDAWTYLRGVLLAHLERIESQLPGAIAGEDPEALHQVRTSTRRTRVAIARVRGVLPESAVERFGKGFRQFQRSSGAKRDLDVLVARVVEERASLEVHAREELAPFERHLNVRLEEERRRLTRVLHAADTTALLADWRALLESETPPEDAPAAAQPVRQVASVSIWKAWRRLRRAAAEVDDDSPVRVLHALRIDGKRLRYLLEFFAPLFDSRETQRLSKSLVRLQDALGDLNDLANQRTLLRAFARSMADEGGDVADALLALGGVLQRLDDRERRLQPKALSRVAAFLDAPRPRQVKRLLGR